MPPYSKEAVLTSFQPLVGLVGGVGRSDLRATEGEKGRVSFDAYLFPTLTHQWQPKQLHHFKREADTRARVNSSEQREGTAASPGRRWRWQVITQP